ncbi:MAG: hypothetical protein WC340_06565 [Kiritimatiellia bacterium]
MWTTCCVAAGNRTHGLWLDVRDFGASGSKFQTTATTLADSDQITVADVGDFKVGQGVMVSKCNIHYNRKSLFGPHNTYAANRALKDEVEVRGYDGSTGSWVVYLLDVDPACPEVFRWTDDFGRNWHSDLPVTNVWQRLSGGMEVRFNTFDWKSGYTVIISARDQLVSTIVKIEGNVLTLRDRVNRTASDAVIRHNDTGALQATIDCAIKEKKHVFVPVGNYRLSGPLTVKNASAIIIEGANAVDTMFDISEGEGACFELMGGTEVTLRNFSMVGHSGFDRQDQARGMRTRGGTAVWGFYFKKCNALGISNTERVLVENCHARKMSAECFYSCGRSRTAADEPKQYTKAITYLRCSVEDCARNAFNNNDYAENTSVLFCRIRDVGGCSWEGASRFVRFIGNYVRNGGTVAMGNIGRRDENHEQFGSGQHIVADNVFEGTCPYGGYMIRAAGGATQVIIRNNLFVNFNSSAVNISGDTSFSALPATKALIAGNIFDMTAIGEPSLKRTAVLVTASDVTVSDNQIYVRGDPDPLLTGISLRDDALNLSVHDNLLSYCGTALTAVRMGGRVGEVLDPATFTRRQGLYGGTPPLARHRSHGYRGWNLVWLKANKPDGLSIIDHFDPKTCHFKLREPREMKAEDVFEMFPPACANWNIHDNTLASCLKPVVLNAYGSETSLFKDNIITRGEAAGVKAAIEISGRFTLLGNHVSGFNEPGSTALLLTDDPTGRTRLSRYCGNRFERCAGIVPENQKSLWDAAKPEGNVLIGLGGK